MFARACRKTHNSLFLHRCTMLSKENISHHAGNADFNAIFPAMDSSMQNELTSKSSMVNDGVTRAKSLQKRKSMQAHKQKLGL
jgi:hypothetical protein